MVRAPAQHVQCFDVPGQVDDGIAGANQPRQHLLIVRLRHPLALEHDPGGERVGDSRADVLEIQDGDPIGRHVEMAQDQRQRTLTNGPAPDHEDASRERDANRTLCHVFLPEASSQTGEREAAPRHNLVVHGENGGLLRVSEALGRDATRPLRPAEKRGAGCGRRDVLPAHRGERGYREDANDEQGSPAGCIGDHNVHLILPRRLYANGATGVGVEAGPGGGEIRAAARDLARRGLAARLRARLRGALRPSSTTVTGG